MTTPFFLGTASWTFPDWQGVFYPDGLADRDRLAWYATQANSVEVNTSFYGLPAPSTLVQWVESVPPGFTFSLKAPRLITHERRLVDCKQASLAFLDVLRSLGTAAAPGFLQFPASFSRAREGRVLAGYLDWLAGELDGLPFGVEVRSADLMTPAFARFLSERGMGLVVVERTGSDDFFAAWEESAAPWLFLRLIGNDSEPLPNDRELQRPQDEILDLWAARIVSLLQKGVPVYCYTHNTLEGHSPASMRRLRERIHARHPLPDWSPEMVVAENDDSASTGQLTLF
ncbi:MAG: DUF72 domain-containing protein [Caldilineaceae bacterium]|nr:DUF72 domain-containing protein [Caldilineaceae bacterium]HRJ44873.1 DUF72 domain-containing protein [Caldilineaceae bacterium]